MSKFEIKVRDLHALAPDDYEGPLFDLVASLDDGTYRYSFEVYCTAAEAEEQISRTKLEDVQLGWDPLPKAQWDRVQP